MRQAYFPCLKLANPHGRRDCEAYGCPEGPKHPSHLMMANPIAVMAGPAAFALFEHR
jgi:hypothetical protein